LKKCQKNAGLAQEIWFWLSIRSAQQIAMAAGKYAVHLQKNSVINYDLLISVSDWSIIMIRPGGLLLVVPLPYLLSLFVSVLWVELQKKLNSYF
jgi:hypothetical protein